MKINEFVRPSTLEDAYKLLNENNDNVVLGGGLWLRLSTKNIEKAIILDDVVLDEIIETKDSFEIGSMTSLRAIETNPELLDYFNGILPDAISQVMGVALRNMATIGGSIMGKYAFSDIIPPLLVMKTDLVFYKQGTMSLEDFLEHKGKLKDILVKVVIHKQNGYGYFKKVRKTALDFAVLNITIAYTNKFEIQIGARPSISMKPEKALEFINNQKKINDDVIAQTAKFACEELRFGSNTRAGQEYRKNVCEVYIKRGLKEVISDES